MAFKIPLLQPKSLSKGYFEGLPSFARSDVTDKEEIGKGSFGSVTKGNYALKVKLLLLSDFLVRGILS